METIEQFTQRFASDVHAVCGHCYPKANRSGSYTLCKFNQNRPRGFVAYVHAQEDRFRICSKKDWASKAGVLSKADDESPGLIFCEDGIWFNIPFNDQRAYDKAVQAIGAICSIRPKLNESKRNK